MKKILFIFMLLFSCNVFAYDIVSNSSAQIYLSYQEPSQNTDGSMINNLDHISVYIDGQKSIDIPTNPAQPGAQVDRYPVTVDLAVGETKTISVYITAVNTDGIESDPSNTALLTMTHELPPPPQPNSPGNLLVE